MPQGWFLGDSCPLSDSCPLTALTPCGGRTGQGSSRWCLRAQHQGLSLVVLLTGSLPEPRLHMRHVGLRLHRDLGRGQSKAPCLVNPAVLLSCVSKSGAADVSI